jgi:hypothetical protein
MESEWTPAITPPEAHPGQWSRKVLVETNIGNVREIAYFQDDKSKGGVWQRPKGTLEGEFPIRWREVKSPQTAPPPSD